MFGSRRHGPASGRTRPSWLRVSCPVLAAQSRGFGAQVNPGPLSPDGRPTVEQVERREGRSRSRLEAGRMPCEACLSGFLGRPAKLCGMSREGVLISKGQLARDALM